MPRSVSDGCEARKLDGHPLAGLIRPVLPLARRGFFLGKVKQIGQEVEAVCSGDRLERSALRRDLLGGRAPVFPIGLSLVSRPGYGSSASG